MELKKDFCDVEKTGNEIGRICEKDPTVRKMLRKQAWVKHIFSRSTIICSTGTESQPNFSNSF